VCPLRGQSLESRLAAQPGVIRALEMARVAVAIVRYVDDHQPGFVECELTDIHKRRWLFVEKVPVVSDENLLSTTSYPREGFIACQILERHALGVRITTAEPFGVESVEGASEFDVAPEALNAQ